MFDRFSFLIEFNVMSAKCKCNVHAKLSNTEISRVKFNTLFKFANHQSDKLLSN